MTTFSTFSLYGDFIVLY